MQELRTPRGSDDLDAAWLTAALAPFSAGASVSAVERRSVGIGQVADSVRLTITWDRPSPAPTTLVAKVPAVSPVARKGASETRTYECESSFYRDVAPSLAVNLPRCYHSEFDASTGGYVVLLEDFWPAAPLDQIAGCTADQAASAISELVALHRSRWNDRSLQSLAWLDHPTPSWAVGLAGLIASTLPTFLDWYGSRIEPDVMELIERFVPRSETYLLQRSEPWTVLHADFRLDNLLFGGDRVGVIDWQTVKLGPAMIDVAYFLGSSLTTDDRRLNEFDLARLYHDELVASGVEMSWDECWRGYRTYGFDGLWMAIAAPMFVTRTDRGDDVFVSMANRYGRLLLDHDGDALVGI